MMLDGSTSTDMSSNLMNAIHALLPALLTLMVACSDDDTQPPPGGQGGEGATGGAVSGGGGSELGGAGGTGGEQDLEIQWLDSTVRFASQPEGATFLGTSDDYTSAHSDFDRGARMRTTDPTTEAEFLQFASEQVREWQQVEQSEWGDAAREVGVALAGLDLELPEEILVIKTVGLEDFAAAYTRRNAIVYPQGFVSSDTNKFELTAHELFHVASRHNPALQETLYPILGFESFDGAPYPDSLESRRITNPDAFSLTHHLTVMSGASLIEVVPILQSDAPLSEFLVSDNPFSLLGLYLLEVDALSGTVVDEVPIDPMDTDYVEQMSLNTQYVIHPEEVMATNFSWMLQRRAGLPVDVPREDVLDAIEDALMP